MKRRDLRHDRDATLVPMTAPDDWPYPDFDPVARADERATLTAFLDRQRATFEQTCAGLDATQMATRSVEPSSMSLLGLVRHLAGVESGWFRNVMAGSDVPGPYAGSDGRDAEFDDIVPTDEAVADAWATWHHEVAFARRFTADAADLDVTGVEKWRGPMSLRWVLVHMIEEYAQHNGHADLLRERIDGHVSTDPMDEVT